MAEPGEAAAVAGMAVVPPNADKRDGYKEINKSRDYLATHMTSGTHPLAAIVAPSGFPPETHVHDISQVTSGGVTLASRLFIYLTDRTDLYSPNGATKVSPNNDGTVYVSGRLNASDLYNNLISGTRRAAWVQDNGLLGYAPSTRASKQNIVDAILTVEQLRAIPVVLYRYRQEVARAQAEPGYQAAVEIGTLADDLHELGLWQFVMYEGRGAEAVPVGVHYELLGLAAITLAQHAFDVLDDVLQRLDRLEGNA